MKRIPVCVRAPARTGRSVKESRRNSVNCGRKVRARQMLAGRFCAQAKPMFGSTCVHYEVSAPACASPRRQATRSDELRWHCGRASSGDQVGIGQRDRHDVEVVEGTSALS